MELSLLTTSKAKTVEDKVGNFKVHPIRGSLFLIMWKKNYFSCKNKIWMKISIYYEEMGIGYARAIKLDFWRGLAEFSKEIRSVILKCVR